MIPAYVSTYDYTLGQLRVAIDLPYRDALLNLSKGLGGSTVNSLMLQEYASKGVVLESPWSERIVALLTGAILLIPVVNILVDLAMRLIFCRTAPHHERDLVEITNPGKIQRRISKAASKASWQQFMQWPGWAFGRALASPEKAPGLHHCTYKVEDSEVGFAELQGRRAEMEDRHVVNNFGFYGGANYHKAKVFAVLDGHGGDGASHFVSRHLKSYLASNLKYYCRDGLSDAGIHQAIRRTFVELDRDYGGAAGTTATVALTIDGDLWVANAGDSRTVLKNGDSSWPIFGYSSVQLSRDLKPGDSDMQRGIKKRGGVVAWNGCKRVNGTLAVARAIGDWSVLGVGGKKCVSPLPKISKVPKRKIAAGSELILACDGLWDVASSNQVVRAVKAGKNKGHGTSSIAADIANAAYQAGSTDNISVMVVRL